MECGETTADQGNAKTVAKTLYCTREGVGESSGGDVFYYRLTQIPEKDNPWSAQWAFGQGRMSALEGFPS